MSVTTLIRRSREQADFLALHADFLDAHSYDVAYDADPSADYQTYNYITAPYSLGSHSLTFHTSGPQSKSLMRKLRRHLAQGMWEKRLSGDTLTLSREINGIPVAITGDRNLVCERIETGEVEEITETAYVTPEEFAELSAEAEVTRYVVTKKVTRPKTEWKCS